MPTPDPVPAFASTLRTLSVLFQRVASETSAAHTTFSKQELLALGVLGVRGPSPMSALAGHLGVGRSAITPLVDRLETQDVVVRHRSDADRRVWLVDLTTQGRAVFEAESEAYERVAQTMLAVLTPEEQQALVKMMGRIEAATVGTADN